MNIKRACAQAIADKLAAAISDFASGGGVRPASADYEVDAKDPALVIVPRSLTFTPWQDSEVLDCDDPAAVNNSLVHVGDFEGTFEFRLYTGTQYDRGELEQKILDQFMADQPGQTVALSSPVVLGGVTTLYPALIVARLEDEEWREELAFAKKRYAFLDASVSFPALSMRTVATIEEIELAIARDIDAVDPEAYFAIDADGSLTET